METLEYMNKSGHEQLLMCSDPEAGLKAVIALHDTTLGPASRRHADAGLTNRKRRQCTTLFACLTP